MSVRSHTTTSTTWHATVCAVVGTTLAAVLAVEQKIFSPTAVLAGRAGEDAGIHIGCAGRSHSGDAVTVHVDLTRHIDDTVGAEGVLEPGVGDLAVDHLGI